MDRLRLICDHVADKADHRRRVAAREWAGRVKPDRLAGRFVRQVEPAPPQIPFDYASARVAGFSPESDGASGTLRVVGRWLSLGSLGLGEMGQRTRSQAQHRTHMVLSDERVVAREGVH